MNTSLNIRSSVLNPSTERKGSNLPLETRQLVTLGRRHFWPFQVLGKGPMPEEPVRLGDWLLVPAQVDSTILPGRACNRIRSIYAAGIRPLGFVLVHEAPRWLKAPVETKVNPPFQPMMPSSSQASPQSTSAVTDAIGKGASALASVLFPMILLFFAAAMIDPILVAVTKEGYWVEIDRWYTK
jgi:hypothetical protein